MSSISGGNVVGALPRRTLNKKPQSGFSLIEISIVLLISGLLLSGLLSLVSAQRTNAAISATRTKGEAIVTALMSFVARNHRLPCPAIADRVPNTAGYGVEAATPGTCTGTTVVGGGVRGGIVPWVSLGLTNEQGSDAYHRRFTYLVRQEETARTPDTISAMRGNMTIHNDTPIGLGLKSAGNPGGNQTNSCVNTNTPDNSCNLDAVVVIISHGGNGYGAFLESGSQMAGAPGALEQENTDNDREFIDTGYSSSETDPFDDMVIALDPDDILRPLAKDGAIPSALAVTMERLNLIRQELVAQIVNAGGEIPFTGPPAGSPKDGWGKSFVYARGTAGGNVCTAPLPPPQLTTFTITSFGVDQLGATPAEEIDNIVVSQNNEPVRLIIQMQPAHPPACNPPAPPPPPPP